MRIPAYIYAFAALVIAAVAVVWFLVELVGYLQQKSMQGY